MKSTLPHHHRKPRPGAPPGIYLVCLLTSLFFLGSPLELSARGDGGQRVPTTEQEDTHTPLTSGYNRVDTNNTLTTREVLSDRLGGSYVIADFTGTLHLLGELYSAPASGGQLLLHFNREGEVSWVQQTSAHGYTVLDDGIALYINTATSGTATTDTQVQKFTRTGESLWWTALDATNVDDLLGSIIVQTLATGPHGTLYVGGRIRGIGRFGEHSLTGTAYFTGFLACLDQTTGDIAWARLLVDGYDSHIHHVLVAEDGQINVFGAFGHEFGSHTIQFEDNTQLTYELGGDNRFLARLDATGTLLGVTALRDRGLLTPHFSSRDAFAIDRQGNTLMATDDDLLSFRPNGELRFHHRQLSATAFGILTEYLGSDILARFEPDTSQKDLAVTPQGQILYKGEIPIDNDARREHYFARLTGSGQLREFFQLDQNVDRFDIDPSGNLLLAIENDELIDSQFHLIYSDYHVNVLYSFDETLHEAGTLTTAGSVVILERIAGPLEGIPEWDRWRYHNVFGWFANLENGWWWSSQLNAYLWIPGSSTDTLFLYYQYPDGWYYTNSQAFMAGWVYFYGSAWASLDSGWILINGG